jgi:hypothetical protein
MHLCIYICRVSRSVICQVSYAVLWAIVLAVGVYLKCVDKRRFAEVQTR